MFSEKKLEILKKYKNSNKKAEKFNQKRLKKFFFKNLFYSKIRNKVNF